MKPYQIIDAAIDDAKKEIQRIADEFNEKTGGVVRGITIDFIDVANFGDETLKTIIGDVAISTTH
jgi:hypothetical protein